jgi:predicted GNAT family acetyltransferase
MLEDETPDTPNDYNRVNAWTDEQYNHIHPTDWKAETATRTQGGYTVAAQHQAMLMQQQSQREAKDEIEFQANAHYKQNYIMARQKGYTES